MGEFKVEGDMLEIRKSPVGKYQSNCYLLVDSVLHHAVLIDPGDQAKKIMNWVGSIEVCAILITHGHHDHVGALEDVQRTMGVPVYMHTADAERFELKADVFIQDGVHIDLGTEPIEFVHLPGHTPGSVGFKLFDSGSIKRVIVGDVIFPGGPGHTESPEAFSISLDTLSKVVFTWPDDVILYPGHGDPTTVGLEREAFEAFCSKPIPADLYGDVTWA